MGVCFIGWSKESQIQENGYKGHGFFKIVMASSKYCFSALVIAFLSFHVFVSALSHTDTVALLSKGTYNTTNNVSSGS